MKLVMQAGDREETVEVVRECGRWRVTVGERTYAVDAAPLGEAAGAGRPHASSLLFVAGGGEGGEPGEGGETRGGEIRGGDQHEVAAHPLSRRDGAGLGGGDAGDRYRVSLGAALPAVEVEVMDPLAHRARASHAGAAAGGTQRVSAMMPGRVVTVLVEEGAAVEAGQGVVVLEAMKMENEIAAEHPGVVTAILVEEGQAVDGGEPLFEIGPPPDAAGDDA